MYEKYKKNIARLGKKWEELNFSEKIYWNTIYLIIMIIMSAIVPVLMIIKLILGGVQSEILHRERRKPLSNSGRSWDRNFPGGYVPGSRSRD